MQGRPHLGSVAARVNKSNLRRAARATTLGPRTSSSGPGPSPLESGLAMPSNERAPSTTDTWALAHLQRCSRFPLSTLGMFINSLGTVDVRKTGESPRVKDGILQFA